MNKITKLAYIMGTITVILMIVNVCMSARVAQDGLAVDTLSRKQQQLQGEIRDLEQQLMAQTSLNDLSVKAESFGYVAPTAIVTVNAAAPLAYNQ